MPPRLNLVNNPFRWDGSYLGCHPSSVLVASCDVGTDHYWRLEINGFTAYCLARRNYDRFPCLADELKPIFGLRKLGSHTITVGSIRYAILRAWQRGNQVLQELTLAEIMERYDCSRNPLLAVQIQEVLVFREILALSSTYESSIHLRTENGIYYPVSFRETSTNLEQDQTVLSRALIERWFPDYDVSRATRRLLRVSPNEELAAVLLRYRGLVEAVIRRINPDYLWCVPFMLNRLSRRLDSRND